MRPLPASLVRATVSGLFRCPAPRDRFPSHLGKCIQSLGLTGAVPVWKEHRPIGEDASVKRRARRGGAFSRKSERSVPDSERTCTLACALNPAISCPLPQRKGPVLTKEPGPSPTSTNSWAKKCAGRIRQSNLGEIHPAEHTSPAEQLKRASGARAIRISPYHRLRDAFEQAKKAVETE